MFTREDIDGLLLAGGNVLTTDGDKIGSIGTVYADEDSGEPTFVTVKTGLFGTSESFVPLLGARIEGKDIVVPYSRDQVKDAPRVAEDGRLDPGEEDRLYDHYGLGTTYTEATRGTGETDTYASDETIGTGRDTSATVGRDTSGPTSNDAEERLNIGTEKQANGRARLRKYVTPENVENVTVNEEIRKENIDTDIDTGETRR